MERKLQTLRLEDLLPFELPDTDEVKQTVKDIADSIKQWGQFNPVIVKPSEGGYQVGPGKKRVAAIKSMGQELVHCSICPPETNLASLEELILHENLRRTHMEWWQRALLVKDYHLRQQAQSDTREVKKGGRPKKGEQTWTARDTAAALSMAIGPTYEDLQLAAHLEHNPSLKNVKDRRTALMLVKQNVKRVDDEIEARTGGMLAEESEDGPKTNEVYFGDSNEILKHFPRGHFDACITDPPWLKFRGIKELEKDETTHLVFNMVFDKLKINSFLYLFCGIDDFIFYRELLPKYGFKVAKAPLIWHKLNAMSNVGVAGWEYGRNFEMILQAVKGSPVLASASQRGSVISHKIVHPKHAIHPHEKPIGIIQDLLLDCTHQGSKVLDPFGGSGVLAEACKISKRSFIIIEKDRSFYERIVDRLSGKLAAEAKSAQ